MSLQAEVGAVARANAASRTRVVAAAQTIGSTSRKKFYMAAPLVEVTLPRFSNINRALEKGGRRRPMPATRVPSLWEDGAFDRLIARRA